LPDAFGVGSAWTCPSLLANARANVRFGFGAEWDTPSREIRVQLAAAGHPVVGDRTYGATTDPIKRLALHATILGFLHPGTGAAVRFESRAPAAFTRVGRPQWWAIGGSRHASVPSI
jgi:hypothetical protein